jgi:hypothetical protein
MKIARLFFRGDFDNVFMYRGRMIVFDQDRRMRVFQLPKIVDFLKTRYQDWLPFYEWLFRRTDWMRNSQAKSLYTNKEYADLVDRITDACCAEVVELDFRSFDPEYSVVLEPDYDALMDCTIYNGFIYVGTESGLYSAKANWKKFDCSKFYPRHDRRVVQASAMFGTINTACGSDGLLSAIENYDANDPKDLAEFDEIETQSYATNWCHYDLVNYPSLSQPSIFRTDTKTATLAVERTTTVCTRVKKEEPLDIWNLPAKPQKERVENSRLASIATAATGERALVLRAPRESRFARSAREDGVRYTFNSDQTFFYALGDGDIYRVQVAYDDNGFPMRDKPKRMSAVRESAFTKIMSTHPLPQIEGAVVETYGSVYLLSVSKGIEVLLDEPAISVRTFPQSKQYQNLICIITDDGLWLMSVFDDRLLRRGKKPTKKNLLDWI